MRSVKRQTLAAAALIALSVPATASRFQAQQAVSSMPGGPLVSRTYTARFAPDGGLEVAGTIEGMGTFRLDGNWSRKDDRLDLRGSLDAAGAKLFAMTGMPADAMACTGSGTYRVALDGADVTLDAVSDTCEPRRMVLDRSRWRPAGTPERPPVRNIVATPASIRPPIPAAAPDPRPWPSFRGREASGVTDGQHLPDHWDVERREHVLWRTPIPGLAHSSPIVWGDRIYVTSAISSVSASFKPGQYGDGSASEDRSRHRWMLYAIDRKTGRIAWERLAHEGAPLDLRHVKSTYASATPATDGRVVVAWFGSQGVHAFTTAGDRLWKVDLGRVDVGAYGMASVEWGPASSPIIWNGLVVLQVDTQTDAFLIALALETGQVVWKTPRDDKTSWSTPSVLTTSGVPELVTSADWIRGYDPRTGVERWRMRSGASIPAPTPIAADGLIFIAAAGLGGRRPLVAVRPGGRGDISPNSTESSNAQVRWSKPARGPFIPTPLVYRSILYVLANNGVLDAYDAGTGEEIYRQRLPAIGSGFSASPVAADGKLYIANEDGQVMVIAAGREFRHIATNSIPEPLMATPALANGVLYLRGASTVFAIGR
jgi:outer membrane protein assembly factor BamB